MSPIRLACALLLVATATFAEPFTETTKVEGDVPADIIGRWFVVAQGKAKTGLTRTIVQAWELRRGSEHLELVFRRTPLPQPITDAIQEAGTAGREWHPSDDDLRAVATTWEGPPAADDRVEVVSRLVAPSAFTPDLADDDVTKGSELAIVVDERFTGAEHIARTTSIFGIRQRTPTTLRGTFVGTTIAIVFSAVPITFTGEFEAQRVDARAHSWWDRLFAGCGR